MKFLRFVLSESLQYFSKNNGISYELLICMT